MGKMKFQEKTKYLGGHPSRSRDTVCTLTMDEEGVHAKILRNFLDVAWSDISAVAVESPEQAQSRVTVTRLLATGIFAFALKKKGKQTSYVTVETSEGPAIFEFEDTDPMKLRAKLSWVSGMIPASH